jgi:hypothetical protein
MENLIKLNVIKDIVTKRLLFLENEEGYKISSLIYKNLEKSELDKYSNLPKVSIFYSNSKINREIQFDVTISSRPYINIENTAIQASFSHNDYFTFINKSKFLIGELPGQNSMEKVESFFTLITKELKGALHNVVNGNEWMDGCPRRLGPV